MELISTFFSSDMGPIIAMILICAGIADIAMVHLPALPIAKKRLELRNALLHTHQPEEKSKLKQQLQGHSIMLYVQTVVGGLLIVGGIYGLTR